MKKIVFLSSFLLVPLLFSISCSLDSKEYTRSMVTYYYAPDKLQLKEYQENTIGVSLTGFEIIGSFRSEGSKSAYDRLCEKHNDMSYNRKITIRGANPTPPNEFLYADLLSIEVSSDNDFDDIHPAGTSLNDLVMFLAVSPKKYIDSGYKNIYNWKKGNHEPATDRYFYSYYDQFADTDKNVPYHPVEKMVSDLNTEDLILLGNGVYSVDWILFLLRFNTLPTENKTHNITVTLTTDEGEVFSDTINMVFE